MTVDRFQPDRFMVASAVRPEGIFSHHSALELLGTAHSVWHQCTLYVKQRRRPLRLDGAMILFLEHPGPMRSAENQHFGTVRIERLGRILRSTGPERTLVEGFRRPALVGGLEELVNSASAFSTLDIALLENVLHRYALASLWAAVGWFLERFQRTFYVPEDMLERAARHCPRSPHYLARDRSGGSLASRWNLIIPERLENRMEPDEH
jgi:predicted transcriptional regulator of viral defense system